MGDKDELKASLQGVKSSLDALEAEYGSGKIDISRYMQLKTEFETKKARLERELDGPPADSAAIEFPIFKVPSSRNPNFTGRRETLERLQANLEARPQALTGLGGVGKSQTALEYAYRHAGDFDLVWWIRAGDDATLTADYVALAHALDLPVKIAAEQLVFVNIARHWLENTDRRWLLIYDNAENPEKLGTFLPSSSKGQVLITSRDQDWRGLADVLPIAPWTPDEASRFLLRRTGASDQQAAARLAELLGRLPLALAQAGAFISQRRTPLDEYAALYEEQRQGLWERETPPSDYEATVTTTWELAFQQIRHSSPAAIALLNLCIFLAPDDIPLSMVRQGAAYLPELAGAATDPFALDDAIAALLRYSLVERDEDSLSVHRVVQDVARARLGAEKARRWVEIAVNLVYHAFSFDEYDLETWPISGRLLAHARTVALRAERRQAVPTLAAGLYQKAGEYLRQQGEYDEARDSVERALAIRQALDETSAETASSLDYLGQIYQEQANYAEARTHHEQALEIRRAILGQEHADTAMSIHNLGLLFQAQGEYEQAKVCHEESLAIRKRVLGDNHPHTAVSLGSLGLLFRRQGEYKQAKLYCEESFAICKRVLGDNHPYTATSLDNLGVLFSDQGEYEQAKSYHEESLAIRRRVLGDNHPHTATSLNNLGGLFRELGEYEQAKVCHEESLAIYKRVLGDNHPKTATSLVNLGVLFQSQGEYEQAKVYYEESLAIYKRVLGDNHPDTAKSLNNLSTLLFLQGKYVAARPYLEQALHIYEKVHGKKHPRLVTILSNLGATMFYLKQFPQARDYLSRAAAICRETDEQYEECQKLRRQIKALGGIGLRKPTERPKRKKKRRR